MISLEERDTIKDRFATLDVHIRTLSSIFHKIFTADTSTTRSTQGDVPGPAFLRDIASPTPSHPMPFCLKICPCQTKCFNIKRYSTHTLNIIFLSTHVHVKSRIDDIRPIEENIADLLEGDSLFRRRWTHRGLLQGIEKF